MHMALSDVYAPVKEIQLNCALLFKLELLFIRLGAFVPFLKNINTKLCYERPEK